MSTTRIVVGMFLGGFLGPGLGITANMTHRPWLNLPALCLVFVGNFLIIREALKKSREKRKE